MIVRAMGGYWASFARNGVPSYPNAPKWPPYKGNEASFMRLDTDSDTGIVAAKGADSLASLVNDLKNDARLNDAKRCLIVNEMGKWMLAIHIIGQLKSATDCD